MASPPPLRLASWNTWGVPTAPHAALRFHYQAQVLRDALGDLDVVVLQEVFQGRARAGFSRMFRSQGWTVTTEPMSSLRHLLSSGLLIASRRPPRHVFHETFGSCAGIDCLAAKGILGVILDSSVVATTHLQDDEWDQRGTVRAEQIDLLRSVLEREREGYPGLPVVCAGDFNIDPVTEAGLYGQLRGGDYAALQDLVLDGTHRPTGRHIDHVLVSSCRRAAAADNDDTGGDADARRRGRVRVEWPTATYRGWCGRRRRTLELSDHGLLRATVDVVRETGCTASPDPRRSS